MNVKLWGRKGHITKFSEVPCDVAGRMFAAHAKILTHPLAAHYRVTVEDPQRGDYVVRDTDTEVLGIGR